MSEQLTNLLAFIIGTFAVAVGQVVAGVVSSRHARQERDAARQDEQEREEQERLKRLIALEAELRLNKNLAESRQHELITGAWLPFQLDAYNAALPHLIDLPTGIHQRLAEAVAIVREYLTFSQLQTPALDGNLDQYRRLRPWDTIEPLDEAADDLSAYLRSRISQ